ncbi:TRIC cation channel family protein [Flammeovirga yaeyamensis]|uniref:TRIC cation channel family protein n=1 Tax=Flammeovirga yaeyamensis TaxID=367791 RepID=A0AAX1N8J8_9BACT|nr:trimeric intracellular cation channel family protein [Flammeovirga yaeyamensis]MBB3700447.1 putative membrane protein YeiH [Flammeovirga yaeyamensis]NMF36929.1 trimeric intracellular cation channel family protein [Flammeovirga yaeyamensis]QWG02525.1 TRIC cation channel family protein [Flammeovirga yaeyamensis]
MNTPEIYYTLGMLGTVAFAVTAVLAVIPKQIDLFGAIVMGIVTAVGGGTIRDMILDAPVFWATDLNYIWVAVVSSIVAFYGNQFMSRKNIYSLMLYLDAVGIAMFVIQGAEKAIALDFAQPVGPVLLGLITAIGGGITRDVLAGNTTLLLKKELYALPLTFGVISYLILIQIFPDQVKLMGTLCATLTFFIRAAAIHWKLHVPNWMLISKRS